LASSRAVRAQFFLGLSQRPAAAPSEERENLHLVQPLLRACGLGRLGRAQPLKKCLARACDLEALEKILRRHEINPALLAGGAYVTTPFVVMYAPLWVRSGDQQTCRFLARAHRKGAYIPAKNAGTYAPPADRRKRPDLFVDTLRQMVNADPLTFDQ